MPNLFHMSGTIKSLAYPVLIVLILALLWIFNPLLSVPQSFTKLDGIAGPYTTIFFVGLLVYLVWAGLKIDGMAWLKLLLFLAVIGHILSVVSLLAAELLLPGGSARLSNSASTVGVLQFLMIQLLFPIVLGGWLLAILAVSSLKVMQNVWTKKDNR